MQRQEHNDAQDLYNRTATVWSRNSPKCLSDLTGRTPLFAHLGNLSGKALLDLGCGEGYCARNYVAQGAASVYGVDISSEMIRLARESSDDERMTFECASIDLFALDKNSHLAKYDVVTAVFVSNYLGSEQLQNLVDLSYSSLKTGGEFVLLHPHPHLPYLRQLGNEGLRFDVSGEGSYFDDVDSYHTGLILDLEGKTIEVRLVHHTLEGLFRSLVKSGFLVSGFRELRLEESAAMDWPNLQGVSTKNPMHVMIIGKKY